MRRTREQIQSNTEGRPDLNVREDHGEIVRSEDILIRSYDHQWGYDCDVTVVCQDGDIVFQEEYYLQPGHITNEVDVLLSGTYTVKATLDNKQSEELECTIDDRPEGTVVIEVGNQTISLTSGLPLSP